VADGVELGYDSLLVATGSRARRLAIVGAGFVGQEVAATARKLGVDVTLIEATATPLARVLPASLGAWFCELHRAEGVRVELGAAGRRGAAGGRRSAGPLARAGRRRRPHRGAARLRDVAGCEHWEPAARMGVGAARSILGLPGVEGPPPSFWSDQYGLRIQLVGEAAGADAIEIDGSVDARNFTAPLRRRGVVVGALLVGRPRELPLWRRRLADARQPQSERTAA
jgi:NADPH-dependent 2,4-dienoyl-CoA reductase/sulfur reductase-like enzyme